MFADLRFNLFSSLLIKTAFHADNYSGLKKMLASGAAFRGRGMENISAAGTFVHPSGLIVVYAVIFSAMRTFKI